jgi:hypothetical protein
MAPSFSQPTTESFGFGNSAIQGVKIEDDMDEGTNNSHLNGYGSNDHLNRYGSNGHLNGPSGSEVLIVKS